MKSLYPALLLRKKILLFSLLSLFFSSVSLAQPSNDNCNNAITRTSSTSCNNNEIQLFSGTCGTLTSLVCGTTTMTGTGLTIGNTYYVRVSNIGTSISSNDRFDICITHPPAIPANDNCANATSLTSGTVPLLLIWKCSAEPAAA